MNIIEKFLAGRKERMAQSARNQFREEVEKEIIIRDMVVKGENLIVLCVNNIVIDAIGKKSNTFDPDGCPIDREPWELINKMLVLREAEYLHLCQQNDVEPNVKED